MWGFFMAFMDNFFNLLSIYPALLYCCVVVISLLFGSFFNVVIHRLPKMLEHEWRCQCKELLGQTDDKSPAEETPINLAYPPSNCPKCGHGIKPWENIPVLSYLFLRGKCSNCKNPISIRYPMIEIAAALLAVIAIATFGFNWMGLSVVVFSWFLLVLSMIDFDTQLLPDNLTYPLLWMGLIVNSWNMFVPLDQAMWGAVAGYLSLWSVYHLFKLLTGKEGMGFGDFKLLAALGAWMGWKMLLLIILVSSFVGAIIGLAMILILGRDKNIPIPFGPYLAIAGWIAMLWGNDIMAAYLGSFQSAAS